MSRLDCQSKSRSGDGKNILNTGLGLKDKKLTKVTLGGKLGDKYGKEFYFDIHTPSQAISALHSQLRGFKNDFNAGNYQIFRVRDDERQIVNSKNSTLALSGDEVIISPAIAGSGTGGGVSIPIPAITFPRLPFISKFAELFLSPIMLTVAASYGGRGLQEQKPSFIFNGPTNTSVQGIAVPLVYGEIRAGSVVISTGIISEELDA